MVTELINILSQFNYPVKRQGSFAANMKYPDSFFTFWNNDTPSHSYYDNTEYGVVWYFDVNFYSIDPALTYSVLDQAIESLKQNGWITNGKGYDVLSDEPTHTGRGIEVFYIQTVFDDSNNDSNTEITENEVTNI